MVDLIDYIKTPANELGFYGIVYLITNLINNKKYIGLTTDSAYKRWQCHSTSKLNYESFLKKAINKHGKENFSIDVVGAAYSAYELGQMEDFYINLYNTRDSNFGYNLRSGGDQNYQHHNDTKKRISETKLANPYIVTKEHRQKISNFHKGKPKSEEHKEKVILANKGKKRSKEIVTMIRENRISLFGKKVKLIDIHTNEELIFRAINEIARYLNIPSQNVRIAIKYGYTMKKQYKVELI